ncbi:MAG: hypothetical protein ACMUEK_00905 [Sodalis sp. (in: enterobacteria)]
MIEEHVYSTNSSFSGSGGVILLVTELLECVNTTNYFVSGQNFRD